MVISEPFGYLSEMQHIYLGTAGYQISKNHFVMYLQRVQGHLGSAIQGIPFQTGWHFHGIFWW